MMMPSSMCAVLALLATLLPHDAHGRRVPGFWERVPYADVQIVKNRRNARKKTAHEREEAQRRNRRRAQQTY